VEVKTRKTRINKVKGERKETGREREEKRKRKSMKKEERKQNDG